MMHGPIPDQVEPQAAATGNPLVAALGRALRLCNRVIVVFAAIALIAACVILSYSVLGRALFHSPNYWQDEAAVFLLVGATFMTAAYVQSQRGHVSIEAFVGLLSPLANRIRLWLVDVASLRSAPSSPGSRGRWRMRPGSTARSRTRCGRRRSPSPTC